MIDTRSTPGGVPGYVIGVSATLVSLVVGGTIGCVRRPGVGHGRHRALPKRPVERSDFPGREEPQFR